MEGIRRIFKERVDVIGKAAREKIRESLRSKGIDTSYFEYRDAIIESVISKENENYLKKLMSKR